MANNLYYQFCRGAFHEVNCHGHGGRRMVVGFAVVGEGCVVFVRMVGRVWGWGVYDEIDAPSIGHPINWTIVN